MTKTQQLEAMAFAQFEVSLLRLVTVPHADSTSVSPASAAAAVELPQAVTVPVRR